MRDGNARYCAGDICASAGLCRPPDIPANTIAGVAPQPNIWIARASVGRIKLVITNDVASCIAIQIDECLCPVRNATPIGIEVIAGDNAII